MADRAPYLGTTVQFVDKRRAFWARFRIELHLIDRQHIVRIANVRSGPRLARLFPATFFANSSRAQPTAIIRCAHKAFTCGPRASKSE